MHPYYKILVITLFITITNRNVFECRIISVDFPFKQPDCGAQAV